jgi:hypothetical protein
MIFVSESHEYHDHILLSDGSRNPQLTYITVNWHEGFYKHLQDISLYNCVIAIVSDTVF